MILSSLIAVAGDEFVVLEYLEDLNAQWYKIGTALKLPSSTLDYTRQECYGDNRQALITVVNHWMNMNYDFGRFGKPSWKALVVAVASRIGRNHRALAVRIAKAHPPKPKDV